MDGFEKLKDQYQANKSFNMFLTFVIDLEWKQWQIMTTCTEKAIFKIGMGNCGSGMRGMMGMRGIRVGIMGM